ncbi:MAG: acylneuraminate cytidylyltransferase family protein [Pseudomonadota bacterium]|nr:acylneuraminate cytidylyltransferase family protein [Pseudomonadota bacterium]
MYRGKRVLGVICARGGSKGLPRKNVLDLGGRPLIAWSIVAAARSELLDRTVISTDDPEIAAAARAAGGDVPFLRPGELASDTARVTDAVIHAYRALGEAYDILVLLQATSPFRRGRDIDACIRQLVDTDAETCVSFRQEEKPTSFIVDIDADGWMVPREKDALLKRRQDIATAYVPNGSVYAVWSDFLVREGTVYSDRTSCVLMPAETSFDIDSALDLEIARGLLTRPGFPPE